jgi:stress response protein YsnF
MLSEYLKAVDNLTMNEENRLKRKVENLQIEKSRIESLEISIKKLEKKYHNN